MAKHRGARRIRAIELWSGAGLLAAGVFDIVVGLRVHTALCLLLGLAGVVVFLAWLLSVQR